MKTTIEGLGCLGMRLLDIQEETRRVVDDPVYRNVVSRLIIDLSSPATLTAVLHIGDETWALECYRADNPDNYGWLATYDKRGCFLGEVRRGAERCWKILAEAEADYDKQADAEEAAIAAGRDNWEAT